MHEVVKPGHTQLDLAAPHPISIPVFSRRYDSFLTPIQFAPFRSSYPTFSSRSDLRYVSTLRTFLRYKCFFIRSFGEPRLRFDLLAKASDCRERSPRFLAIAVKNHREFAWVKCQMSLLFSCSRCDDYGAPCYPCSTL